MELKKYQQQAVTELESYVRKIRELGSLTNPAKTAFIELTGNSYNQVAELGGAPFVCIKIPTGGGKTLVAVHEVGMLYKEYLRDREDKGLVLWFVPSDGIKTQTLSNLQDREHPYRQVLDERFNNAVMVMDLEQAKAIKREDLENNLCIVISTLAAFRRENKEGLKVYEDNGSLLSHFENLPEDRLENLDKDDSGQIKYSLANLVSLNNPLIVVDEGHNAQTSLAFDMFERLNPSFVLEFTATPKGLTNVLVNITAQELKKEHMIKMPILLSNVVPWEQTLREGYEKRQSLENITKKNKENYIRPIMLIQAEQEKESEKRLYVAQIQEFLINGLKIDKAQIAVQTGTQKDLPPMKELLSKKSPIRYIITVNALREGWDCPFAYVLVSVSKLGARLAVEQTIGRIMRLPFAQEQIQAELNQAYVFASTSNFTQATDMVIKGLQENGYDVVKTEAGITTTDHITKKLGDFKLEVPYISYKNGKEIHRLDYLGDLIAGQEILPKKLSKFEFTVSSNVQVEKIDVGEKGMLIKETGRALKLIYHDKDITQESLINWLCQKVRRGYLALNEVRPYIQKVVSLLIPKMNLKLLNSNRYFLIEKINLEIDRHAIEVTTERFKELSKQKIIEASSINFELPDQLHLVSICEEGFQRHVYDKAAVMNGEELAMVQNIDVLENVEWWLRNPEKTGFYLQGWESSKFYPDFIVKTKKGNYFMVEYKGEHLQGSDDSNYKQELGEAWAKLAGEKYHFAFVGKKEVSKLVDEIKGF